MWTFFFFCGALGWAGLLDLAEGTGRGRRPQLTGDGRGPRYLRLLGSPVPTATAHGAALLHLLTVQSVRAACSTGLLVVVVTQKKTVVEGSERNTTRVYRAGCLR
jgi:hypothetical protein